MKCFNCNGSYVLRHLDYKTKDGKGESFTIKDVPHLVCDECGDCCFPKQATDLIEKERAKRGVKYERKKNK